MQGHNPDPTGRRPCPPPVQPTLFGWFARILGLNAPAYRGLAQPMPSGGGVFGRTPNYRPPRPPAPPASCHGDDGSGPLPPIEGGIEGGAYVAQSLVLDGPVTIVVGPRE